MKFHKTIVLWKCFRCGKADITRSENPFFNPGSVDIDESCVALKFNQIVC